MEVQFISNKTRLIVDFKPSFWYLEQLLLRPVLVPRRDHETRQEARTPNTGSTSLTA